MSQEPKFPNIEVQLAGTDGNAFMVIGRVRQALLRGGASIAEAEEFVTEAKSGDYDNVLITAMKWVTVS